MNWKKMLCCGLVTASLAGTMGLTASAAEYTDLDYSHWAYYDMNRAVNLKIIKGMGEGMMAPDAQLTWGQFLVMMARTCAPWGYGQAVANGQSWDVAGLEVLKQQGIVWDGDPLGISAEMLGQPITRKDVVVMLDRALPADITEALSYWGWREPVETALTDLDTLGEMYRSAVTRLYDLNVVRGNDQKNFDGDAVLKRADGTVLLMRALELRDNHFAAEPMTVTVYFRDQQGQNVGQPVVVTTNSSASLGDAVTNMIPEGYLSSDYNYTRISTGCLDYEYTIRRAIPSELHWNEMYDMYYNEVITEEQFNLMTEGDNSFKRQILFGTDEYNRFETKEAASAAMTSVEIPAWKIDRKGNKVATKYTIQVNKGIADNVVGVFTDIFYAPEQFPIHAIGGFRWGDGGEHTCGTAIDINWDENYQVRDGKALVGQCWEPGTNPYSIDPYGSVVQAFNNHGWSWGGDAWAGHFDQTIDYHDYMHFSYMGR